MSNRDVIKTSKIGNTTREKNREYNEKEFSIIKKEAKGEKRNMAEKKKLIGIKEIRKWSKIVLLTFIAVCVAFTVINVIKITQGPKITNSYISNRLEKASELTSAKLTYNGIIHYTNGKIPFLTKKAFLMTYHAEVKAGIDLSQVEVNVSKSDVKITIPEIKILDLNVDGDTIQFYDEKSALFNWTKKEDVVDAIQTAKDDVNKNADIEELKTKAKEQTATLLEGLFENSIGNRKLVIVYK
jgi:hypothetical protein